MAQHGRDLRLSERPHLQAVNRCASDESTVDALPLDSPKFGADRVTVQIRGCVDAFLVVVGNR